MQFLKMRFPFPVIVDDFELEQRSYNSTESLLKTYLTAVYSQEESVNIYVSGTRVYTWNGQRWSLSDAKETLDRWANIIEKYFCLYLRSRRDDITQLSHGEDKWARIETRYFNAFPLCYNGRKKNKDTEFDAMTLLREISGKNKSLRVRRQKFEHTTS